MQEEASWRDTPSVRVAEGVTRASFQAEIVSAAEPVVMRNLAGDWPIVEAGRTSPDALASYLLSFAADRPVEAWFGEPAIAGRFGYSDDLGGFNHERRTVALAELLAYMLDNRDDPAAFSAFAGAIPIGRTIPALLPLLPMPLLEAGGRKVTSLWLGGRSRTAAHWDLPQNLACVVAGRRRFTLFPTEQVRNLYVGPLDFTLAGQPSSLVDFAAPDLARFPKFHEAMENAQVAELAPGDVLYIPSLWWHHVETPDAVGAMINFWWRDGPPYLMSPLSTLFHALLTMRDLPDKERAAWRTMFDHYIFEANGDPMAHIPEPARGVFAPMTPDILRRLKALLAERLR